MVRALNRRCCESQGFELRSSMNFSGLFSQIKSFVYNCDELLLVPQFQYTVFIYSSFQNGICWRGEIYMFTFSTWLSQLHLVTQHLVSEVCLVVEPNANPEDMQYDWVTRVGESCREKLKNNTNDRNWHFNKLLQNSHIINFSKLRKSQTYIYA